MLQPPAAPARRDHGPGPTAQPCRRCLHGVAGDPGTGSRLADRAGLRVTAGLGLPKLGSDGKLVQCHHAQRLLQADFDCSESLNSPRRSPPRRQLAALVRATARGIAAASRFIMIHAGCSDALDTAPRLASTSARSVVESMTNTQRPAAPKRAQLFEFKDAAGIGFGESAQIHQHNTRSLNPSKATPASSESFLRGRSCAAEFEG